MKRRLYYLFLIHFVVLIFSACNKPQVQESEVNRRKSPIAIASITHNDTYIKIVYGQPYKKNRQIFGALVPYEEVWRTGANEATELTTTNPIQINGRKLDKGTYALFTIPHISSWTLVLNSQLGQWGAFEYDSAYDVFRTEVPVETIEQVTEAFTIQFGEIKDDSTSILLKWDTTQVSIPIQFL